MQLLARLAPGSVLRWRFQGVPNLYRRSGTYPPADWTGSQFALLTEILGPVFATMG